MPGSIATLRIALFVLALLLAAWAVAVFATGGGTIAAGPIRLSSKSADNPAAFAVIAAVAAWLVAPAGARTRTLVLDVQAGARGAVRHSSEGIAVMAAASVILVGALEGAFVAGGSDSYGYLSQARSWAAGTLTIEEPLMREMRPVVQPEAWAPLGYIPARNGPSMVPIYSPGLPMVMAAFDRFGGERAVFAVVPLCAGLLVWTTFLLGRAVAGPQIGAAAAVLMASSPTMLFQLTAAPMSDIPVAAWWTLSLVLVGVARPWSAWLSGIAAGLAILTRPNLAPVAIVPMLMLAWRQSDDRGDRRIDLKRAAPFAIGAAPACAVVGLLNAYWYGSPFSSGYGPLDDFYELAHLVPNLRLYPEWLIESQTPLVLLAFVAPWAVRWLPEDRRPASGRSFGPLLWFFAAIAVCYLFYFPFNIWWYLRFLLPGFPALFIGMAITLAALSGRLAGRFRWLPFVAITALLAWHGVRFARAANAFDTQTELKYKAVGTFIAQRLPENAVIIARMHSGSVRYYSGRRTLRFDYIDPVRLDALAERLIGAAYHPYLVLEGDEMAAFRQRFSSTSRLGSLDWPAMARLPLGDIRVFDAAPPGPSGHESFTETIK